MSDGRHTSELRSVSRCRMRARSSTWARRADRPPAYRHGANYRTYKPSAISWGTQAKPGPRAMHIQRRSPGPARARPQRRDNNQRNKPTYDQQGYTSAALDPRASRGQRVRWIFMNLLHAYAVEEVKETFGWGELAGGFIVVALICLSHIRGIDRWHYNLVLRSDRIIESFVRFYQLLYWEW